MNKVLVLFSGGMDSTTVLYWARQRKLDVLALSFDYPGRPNMERKAAQQIVTGLDMPHVHASLPFLQVAKDIVNPTTKGQLLGESPGIGYIPMRNLVFYAVAGYYAEVYGLSHIIGGHTQEDSETYSDASEKFFDLFQPLYEKTLEGSYVVDQRHLEIVLPLGGLSDEQVTKLGRELGVPFESTWSCWHDELQPCGVCFACSKRAEALR